jgi:Spy/CpxP family protein refolding chaperone
MITALFLTVLPLSAAAQQQTFPDLQPVDPHHGDMMQGQGMGGVGGMGPGGGMGMGGGHEGCCMEQHGQGDHHGHGMMDGEGRGGGMAFLGPIRMLDLNADQRIRLSKIELDLRKQLHSLMGTTFDPRAQLYDLYGADRPDPKKIGAVYGRLFDVKRQMIEAKIDAMNRARDVLTREQLQKLKELKPGPHHWDPDLD